MLIITLHNDGTGDVNIGNYNYVVRVNDKVLERGSVKNHKRRNGWQDLVKMMLHESTEMNRLAMLAQYADLIKDEADALH